MHRVIQFDQKAWLKPYDDMNTELRKKAKNEFDEYCCFQKKQWRM